MVAAEKLGWVDRRCVDRPVGRDRRRNQTRRMGDTKMTREIADWFHRYRWWPWLFTLIVMPPLAWPSSFWFDVDAVSVSSAPVGSPLHMTVDRKIKRPFRGSWQTTVRQWDGAGWVTWCNARGASNYRPESRFPKDLSLQWWTDGQCHPVPQGRYKITTTWIIRDIQWMPDKTVTADSNIFEVR